MSFLYSSGEVERNESKGYWAVHPARDCGCSMRFRRSSREDNSTDRTGSIGDLRRDGLSLHGPEVLTPGRVALNFVNETEAEVWLGWWLLNDDVEYEKFAQQNNPTQGLPMTLIASEKIWYVGGKRPIYVTTGTNALACVLHIGSGISARVTETMDFMSVEVTA